MLTSLLTCRRASHLCTGFSQMQYVDAVTVAVTGTTAVAFPICVTQIFQGQCDGLQTAVTNMQLEIEGNLQCTTAMKNRVRLLRKESRKQVRVKTTAHVYVGSL